MLAVRRQLDLGRQAERQAAASRAWGLFGLKKVIFDLDAQAKKKQPRWTAQVKNTLRVEFAWRVCGGYLTWGWVSLACPGLLSAARHRRDSGTRLI